MYIPNIVMFLNILDFFSSFFFCFCKKKIKKENIVECYGQATFLQLILAFIKNYSYENITMHYNEFKENKFALGNILVKKRTLVYIRTD